MRNLLAAALLLTPACAAAGGLSIKGYLKSYVYSVEPANVRNFPAPQPDGPYPASESKLRLKSFWDGGPLKAEAAYELIYSARAAALARAQPLAGDGAYRVSDFGPFLAPSEGGETASAALLQDFGRAFITWSPPAFDLYAGRQPLAFGAARSVNPTDVLSPYAFGTIDTEERRGVDALRVKLPWAEMGEFDAGWLPGEGWRAGEGAGFVRGKAAWRGADLTALAAAFKGNLLAGGDIEREWGGAMLRAEAAQVWAGSFGGRAPGEDFFSLSAGGEYNFPVLSGLDSFLEYHYNGAGAVSPRGYGSREGITAYEEASVYLLGRHYLNAGAGAQLTPLVSAGFDVLLNLGDRSFYAIPEVEWNAARDLYLSAGALLPSGPRAAFRAGAARPVSEFGLYDRSFYASIRFYF